MPIVKTKRNDILRRKEILDTLDRAGDKPWLQCLIAVAWLFGKRINEILRLRRRDVWTTEQHLYIRFYVSKKRSRRVKNSCPKGCGNQSPSSLYCNVCGVKLVKTEKSKGPTPVPRPFVKRITLKHVGVKYITPHIRQVEEDQLLFLGHLKQTGGSRRVRAWQYLKEVNPESWWHLFRESLATEMSERGATEEELLHWFDWEKVETAHDYVKRGTKLTEKWSERTW